MAVKLCGQIIHQSILKRDPVCSLFNGANGTLSTGVVREAFSGLATFGTFVAGSFFASGETGLSDRKLIQATLMTRAKARTAVTVL